MPRSIRPSRSSFPPAIAAHRPRGQRQLLGRRGARRAGRGRAARTRLLRPEIGWRLAFLIGAALGLVVFFMRMWIPESPRWLVIHGREPKAEAVVAGIEQRFAMRARARDGRRRRRSGCARAPHAALRGRSTLCFGRYRRRTLVGLVLMAAQAFFYNAIFFTYALVLTTLLWLAASDVGWYMLPFAAGNFLGPVVLGRLFDTLGRRRMIAATYALSGAAAGRRRRAVRRGLLTAMTPDARLDDRVLLRLARRQRGLSDRERDLPDRDPRAHDRDLLRLRHRDRRRRRAARFRPAHRQRVPREPVRRLLAAPR